MSLYIGTDTAIKAYIGDTSVSKIYRGATQIFPIQSDIDWSVKIIEDDIDVSTNGTLIQALNFGRGLSSDLNTTINGVLFAGLGNENNDINTFNNPSLSPFSANSTNCANVFYPNAGLISFSSLLSTGLFAADISRNVVTISDLTIGQTYQIQLFFADNRTTNASIPPRKPIIDYGTPNEFNLAPTYGGASPNGLVVNGTFTATETTKTFTINNFDTSTNTLGGIQLHAYQLRLLP